MFTRRWVWLAVVFAVLGRFCGALWPLRPDEAGFLLVARSWDPQPDALYHPYFVDRPPLMLGVVRLADTVGGAYALRVVGALACGAAVLLTAALVRELARHLAVRVAQKPLDLVIVGTSLLTAAFLVTPQIDATAVKGEILGVPLILASCLLSLRALRQRSVLAAGVAGLVAMTAVGLKQSLVGGLVFGGVLLFVALLTKQLAGKDVLRMAGAALLGAAIPVAATIGWALAVGVKLSTLEYAVIGFRSDASAVILSQSNEANIERAWSLVELFATTGMVLVLVWGLVRLPGALRRATPPTVAVLVMLVVDATVLCLSGSFWAPYLFTLIPPLVMLWACVRVVNLPHEDDVALDRPARGTWFPRVETVLVSACVISTLGTLVAWPVTVWHNGSPPRQYEVGRAIAEVAAPDDTLVVYGGRADLQWASGLDSPYEHLWSLPMRTMDPELATLRALLEGPDAPEWFVGVVTPQAWDGLGERGIADVLAERYEDAGTWCGGIVVRRLAGAPEVEPLTPDCTTPRGRR